MDHEHRALQALLVFYSEAGVDAPLGETAVDRLAPEPHEPMRTTVASAHYRRMAAAALARRMAADLFAMEPR